MIVVVLAAVIVDVDDDAAADDDDDDDDDDADDADDDDHCRLLFLLVCCFTGCFAWIRISTCHLEGLYRLKDQKKRKKARWWVQGDAQRKQHGVVKITQKSDIYIYI